MEAFLIIFGSAIIYSTVHYIVISFKQFKKLTPYQKVIQIVGVVSISLVMLGVMFGNN